MTDSIYQKHAILVDRLLEKTLSKKSNWKQQPFSDTPYTQLGDFKVELETGTNGGGSPVEIVTLKNKAGQVIDRFNDEELSEYSPDHPKYDSYWRAMEALREAASRQALGSEEALDAILGELDDGDEL
jgi:hypothetical protein